MSIPAGWYPNPDGSPTQRYWDGGTWTDQVHAPAPSPQAASQPYPQPYAYAPIPTAPEGTRGATVFAWLFAAIPVLALLQYTFFDIDEYTRLSASARSTADLQHLFVDTGYLGALALGLAVYAISVVLAALDAAQLKRRGVPRPFGWGWAFLGSIVYIIGRSVVASRRRTTGWAGPLILWIVVVVVTSGVSVALGLGAAADALTSVSALG